MSGGEQFPLFLHLQVIFIFLALGGGFCPVSGRRPPGGILFSFLTLDCGFCPASGRGRLRGGRQGAGKAIINKVAVRNLQSFAIKTQHTFNIFFLLYCWLSKFTNFGIKILTIHGVWTISFQTKFNKFPYQKRERFFYISLAYKKTSWFRTQSRFT